MWLEHIIFGKKFYSWKCALNDPKQGNNPLYKNIYSTFAQDSEKMLDQPLLLKQKRGIFKKSKKYFHSFVKEHYSAVI